MASGDHKSIADMCYSASVVEKTNRIYERPKFFRDITQIIRNKHRIIVTDDLRYIAEIRFFPRAGDKN
ncbi:hypothetical protein EBR21_07335 [bacterium]|nr:hypothetical protein [bacterium]